MLLSVIPVSIQFLLLLFKQVFLLKNITNISFMITMHLRKKLYIYLINVVIWPPVSEKGEKLYWLSPIALTMLNCSGVPRMEYRTEDCRVNGPGVCGEKHIHLSLHIYTQQSICHWNIPLWTHIINFLLSILDIT